MDRQSQAFREAGPNDLVLDEQIDLMIEDGALLIPGPSDPIKTPEEWNATGWDANADEPKTLEEAKAALQARVLDPHAPDSDATAYDGLDNA